MAYLLDKRHFSNIAAVTVQAHHCGFPDLPVEARKENAFRDTSLMAKTDGMLSDLEKIHNELVGTVYMPGSQNIKGDHSVFSIDLSCLADADHTDTGLNYGKYPIEWNTNPLRPKERLAQLDKYVAGLKGKGSDDKRDALRREMYSVCRSEKPNANIVSCDSPVGSGKTTSIMAHLLTQAAERKLRRIFIVLPYTNIIKQSVDIYRKALILPGEQAEDVVAELHYRADFENEDVRHMPLFGKLQ